MTSRKPAADTVAGTRTETMRKGRQADSARRRQRVLTALDRATASGHRDQRLRHRPRRRRRPHLPLPAPRPARENPRGRSRPAPRRRDTAGPAVTRASLQADLLAAHERAIRLNARIRQLEQRLSDALGEQAWRESGLGAPADIDALNQKITHLEQQAADLRLQLEERDDELAAARAANRELMTRLNHSATTR